MQIESEFKWKKGDALAIAGVLFLALAIFLSFTVSGYGVAAARAEIYLNGRKLKEVDLSKDQTFSVQGAYVNEITVRDGKISVSYSDCPGEDCVHSGWKSRAGESIICLPNQMEIRILGESSVDFVTGQ